MSKLLIVNVYNIKKKTGKQKRITKKIANNENFNEKTWNGDLIKTKQRFLSTISSSTVTRKKSKNGKTLFEQSSDH